MNDEMKMLLVKHLKNAVVTIEDFAVLLNSTKKNTFCIVTGYPRVDIFSILDEILDAKEIAGMYRQEGTCRSIFHIEDVLAIVTDKIYKNRDHINSFKYVSAKAYYENKIKDTPPEVLEYVRQFKIKKSVNKVKKT